MDIEFVLFKVINGQTTYNTGRTSGYNPPAFDSNSAIRINSLSFIGGRIILQIDIVTAVIDFRENLERAVHSAIVDAIATK